MRRFLLAVAVCTCSAILFAQAGLSDAVRQYVSVAAPTIVITHVRVIDGTGTEPREDQAIVIANGTIEKVGPAAGVSTPTGATVLEKPGFTVIPGLVGMHEHL